MHLKKYINILKYMDKTKIPWIECVITIPEQIEENFNKLISIYKKKSRSKKKLKKKITRITTDNLLSINEITEEKEITDDDMFNQLALFVSEIDKITPKLENKIIDYIELIIKKYINIYLHTEDKTLLISEKNKDSNKIFLKFYFPRIINDTENKTQIDIKANKFGDNIHFTVLPEIIGHGKDGMFHLTFRIESKNGKPIYEYSKFISFNIVDNKVGIILYDDEKGNNAVVFRISENINLLKIFIINLVNSSNFDFDLSEHSETINTQVYKDLCLYIALDIFKKLFNSKKIDNFFTRYFNSFGIETVYKMINKLLSIIFSTFINLYKN
jgi:hypothetical protein